jgi:membrane fusion protein, copper/silver efflux system
VVTAKTVVQGSRIAAGDTPFEITDLSQVWVLADAHESDLPRVQVGTPVSLTLDALPNRIFTGKVSFIEPVLDPKTRTAKVRLAFPNPRGELRLEMFGEVVFHTRPHDSLRVPADSIIDSGDRKVVFVATGEGRFEPREVKTGEMGGDMVEVLSGVRAGEHVVVRASFLVDSESRLKAALAALASKPPAAPEPKGRRGAKP